MDSLQFQIYEPVLGRMSQAGWLNTYALGPGRGMQLGWTPDGWRRAYLLRRIIESFQLNANPLNAVNFDTLCASAIQGETHVAVDPAIATFWYRCMGDLKLARDEMDFITLLQALSEFGPSDSKRVAEVHRH